MPRNRQFDPDHPTGAQLRAARGLLNVSVLEVAEQTRLVPNTVKRAESTNDLSPTTRANARLLTRYFIDRGVVFIAADNAAGAGVRLALDATFKSERRRRSGATGGNSIEPDDAAP